MVNSSLSWGSLKFSIMIREFYFMKHLKEVLGVSAETLRTYEVKNWLKFEKSKAGTKYITRENLLEFLKQDKGL
jgi:DNA-binding transcriptional MerR regulator